MLKNFFNPKSIVVVGVSRDKKKVGYLVYENIHKFGFGGKVFPVNIHGGKIDGKKLYESVNQIEEDIDLAIVVVPANAVPKLVRECAQKKINSLIVISSGFSEVGQEGKLLEKEIQILAESFGMRILGPNCLGIVDSYHELNASFATVESTKSNISVFSQSGAIGSAILDWSEKTKLGFSKFISLGNQMDLNEIDLMDYFASDSRTGVILGYLEGIKQGRKFIESASRLSEIKPIIIAKSGRTKAGAKSASSHTGSIAGSEIAVSAALKQAGVIRAETLEEMFDLAKVFSCGVVPSGRRIAIISNAGGPIVMSVDALEDTNLILADLSQKTMDILKKYMSKEVAIKNPTDILGDALPQRYEVALDAVLKDDKVDAVFVILTPQTMTDPASTARIIVQKKKFKKPIVVSFIGGEKIEEGKKILEESRVPFYDFPEKAVRSLDAFCDYHLSGKRQSKARNLSSGKKQICAGIIEKALTSGAKTITDGDLSAFDILESYQVPCVLRGYGKGFEKIKAQAQKIKYPLVLKTAAEGIIHKTDIGGLVAGIENEKDLRIAYELIRRNVKGKSKDDPEKMGVYRMEKSELEVFLGARQDPDFGPLLVFGGGGIFVELGNDFSYRIAPINKQQAIDMIMETKFSKVLEGYRTGKKMDIDGLADTIVKIGHLMNDFPAIKELDINPIMIRENSHVVLDAKIVLG